VTALSEVVLDQAGRRSLGWTYGLLLQAYFSMGQAGRSSLDWTYGLLLQAYFSMGRSLGFYDVSWAVNSILRVQLRGEISKIFNFKIYHVSNFL
jgi:hypothetical protein